MLFAKKELPTSSPEPAYRLELDYLYARRSAIDTLIESLEEYDRFRSASANQSELQTA
jgi:hypothetical protein